MVRPYEKKAICFLSHSFRPIVGGAERQLQRLAEGLAAQGETVWVVTRRDRGLAAQERHNGVDVYRIRVLWWPVVVWFSCPVSFLSFLWPRRYRIRIIYTQSLSPAAWAAAWVGGICRIPVILRLTSVGIGANLDALLHSVGGNWKWLCFRAFVDFFIVLTRTSTEELYRHDVRISSIKWVPNSIHPTEFHPPTSQERLEARRDLGLGRGPIALFVGRLDPVKNLPLLVEAWKAIQDLHPDAHLAVIGDGPERPALEAQINREGLNHGITLYGQRVDLQKFYWAADVLVLPSSREGISNVLLEAFASGLPAVATAVGGTPDVVLNEVNGVLVTPGDGQELVQKLFLLLKDPGRRARLANGARRTVTERFNLTKRIADYRALFRAANNVNFRRLFPILAYHRVPLTAEYGIDIPAATFQQQMTSLSCKGWRSISLEEVLQAIEQNVPFPPKTFCITFDDGHRDNFTYAVPILRQFRFTATFFVSAQYVGTVQWIQRLPQGNSRWVGQQPASWDSQDQLRCRRFEFLTWEEVKLMRRAGFSFGSHALTHPTLTDIPEDAACREITLSKTLLEEHVDQRILFFCYPYGATNERVQQLVCQAGYRGAVRTVSTYDLCGFWENLFLLERIGVSPNITPWRFRWLMVGRYQRVRRLFPRSLKRQPLAEGERHSDDQSVYAR